MKTEIDGYTIEGRVVIDEDCSIDDFDCYSPEQVD